MVENVHAEEACRRSHGEDAELTVDYSVWTQGVAQLLEPWPGICGATVSG